MTESEKGETTMTQVRERIQVTGDKLVETIKKLVHEGNVRK